MSPPLVELRNVSKRFFGTQAVDNVSLTVDEGTVHVLLGENGAGKSTLMKILAGVVKPDTGVILIQGRKAEMDHPWDALRLGIGMVYQELTLVPTLSVVENICLGGLPRKGNSRLVDWKAARERTRAALERLGVDIDPDTKVRNLELGQQQLIEIARAISRNARLIILDEPTSALTSNAREKLFSIVRALKKEGVAFIYITHHLEEVPMIGDMVSVLRDGKLVATKPVSEVDEQTLIKMMVGRTLEEQYPREEVCPGEEALRVEGLAAGNRVKDVTFAVRYGEVLGIAGLMGAGRTELLETVFGLRRADKGTIWVNGTELKVRSPQDAIRAGMALVTEDRKNSLVLQNSIKFNLTLASLRLHSRIGLMNRYREVKSALDLVKGLRIEPPQLTRVVRTLSGGNQQKVVLGKWLCSKARIFLLDDPTRGIDVGAKVEVYRLINQLKKSGAAVVVVSSDMGELMGICDRIAVMRTGRLVREYEARTVSQEEILAAAMGGTVA
ncbi:sugar ABC transporter ATP-binding protein [Thermanaeromonas sp. C210]|uniref:sugar ABC transporter ATP-binding protein n=1 Tax=Thermanaeromonas sp. C210 TaxID=2731925 RepID=UPI00155B52A1|nr:sugar ABC transporter ATP-binding protein [Thermanaeromonas sp. C210]GFN22584.1 ABC transporter ATP-binding protein [Thermanaeromonas sp. C210]